MPSKQKPLSLGQYAKHRAGRGLIGTSVTAVSNAIDGGRLDECLISVDGKPKIFDVELADLEWKNNTRQRVDYDDSPDGDGDVLPEGIPKYTVSVAVRAHHAARREAAQADLAEIQVDEKLEELVPADETRAYIDEKFTLIKGKLRGVPSRIVSAVPELSEKVDIIEKLIAEVLEELAVEVDGDDDDEDDDEE